MYIGHEVPKDTVIFVNNHKLNMSPELWENPEQYDPSRFLDDRGDFFKPSHFQPFSMGKRSCMGYKMVHHVAFSILANVLKHFDISDPTCSPDEIPLGMLALPPQPFQFTLKSVDRSEVVAAGISRRNHA
jgi:cytochrome P450 family 307 subfamily A